jgi:hypothetical protein
MFQPIFETFLLFKYKILTNLPNTLFLYIIPFQYYIAILYFRSQRKKRIYESGNMDFLHDGTGIGKCLPEENTLIKSVSVVSIFIIIESIITLFLISDAEIYNKLSIVVYWISKIITLLSIVPGRIILIINCHVFFFSFLQQLQKIQDLEKKLKIRKWKNNKQSSVALLCYEIIDVRYTISRLIEKTEYMYICTTLIGGISIGIILNNNIWDYHNLISFTIFGILQSVFLLVIALIGNARVELNKIIHRRNFASKYILSKNDFCQACLNVEKNFIDIKNNNNFDNKLEDSYDIKIDDLFPSIDVNNLKCKNKTVVPPIPNKSCNVEEQQCEENKLNLHKILSHRRKISLISDIFQGKSIDSISPSEKNNSNIKKLNNLKNFDKIVTNDSKETDSKETDSYK